MLFASKFSKSLLVISFLPFVSCKVVFASNFSKSSMVMCLFMEKYPQTFSGVQRSEAAAMGADVIIFAISALDGWTHDDTLIFERIESIQVASCRSIIPHSVIFLTVDAMFLKLAVFSAELYWKVYTADPCNQ